MKKISTPENLKKSVDGTKNAKGTQEGLLFKGISKEKRYCEKL